MAVISQSPQPQPPRKRFAAFSPFHHFSFVGRRRRQIDQAALRLPTHTDDPAGGTGGHAEELRLYQMNIGDARVLQIANSLRHLNTIKTLDLSNNKFGDEGAFALGSVLPLSSLTRLSLGSNPLVGVMGIASIADSLQTPECPLQALSLSNMAMGNVACQMIAKALHTNSKLQELLLHSNIIGNAGAQALGQALQVNTSLRALDLSDNSISDQGIDALIEGLQVNTTLKHLFLGDNQLSVRALQKLRDLVATDNATLLILDAKTHDCRVPCQTKLKVIQTMEHFLSLNRHGRHLLRQEPTRAILPLIYARVTADPYHASMPTPSPEMLYGLIRELPHLIAR
jgi:Ran GTPase-activating protein (RanGAP) involved in mRNA processing and transport